MKPLFLVLILLTASPSPAATQSQSGQLNIGGIPLATDSGNITLESLRGKIIYLDFWASWCGPCLKSFPWMNEMHRKYSNKGLVIVAVNVDEKRVNASRFLTKIPADFIIAYDPEGKLASSLRLKAMPSSYIITPDGSIANSHIGFMEKKIPEYEKAIRAALGL